MAAEIAVAVKGEVREEEEEEEEEATKRFLIDEDGRAVSLSSSRAASVYLGLSFAVFLAFLPRSAISFVTSLQSRNRALSVKLIQAEEHLRQMKSRRKEDSKANARVVEIFASHRNGWQQEEKKLLQQIDASTEENVHLRARIEELEKSEAELRMCVEKLQREVDEREEMINFMSRQAAEEDDEDFAVRSVEKVEVKKELEIGDLGVYSSQIRRGCGRCLEENDEFRDQNVDFSRFGDMRVSEGLDPVQEEYLVERDDDGGGMAFSRGSQNDYSRDFLSSASKFWMDSTNGWQDMQYDFLDSQYQLKHFVARRESPWKVDGESTGVPSKLKLLEQELVNLERIDKGELSKVPLLMRKQAKRYQALSGKIDDLCRRMQSNDPCEPTLSPEFRTRRQTEFLLEAYRLQQRAIETGQKLTSLQTDIAKSSPTDNLVSHTKLTTKRSVDSIRNNLKEIQRNLEIWLARIMGDLEGILARDGASRLGEFHTSKYPFVR